MTTEPEPPGRPSGSASASPVALAAVQELRARADSLRTVEAAAAAAEWDDDAAWAGAVAEADAHLATWRRTAGVDIAASEASPHWRSRIDDYARSASPAHEPTPAEAAADVVVAVGLARAAVADAVRCAAAARVAAPQQSRSRISRRLGAVVPDLGRRVAAELRHIIADSPRAILVRIVITLAIALSVVAFYHFTGLTRYDTGRLTLYLFSAVVGSMVCTNALCFEAQRVRSALAAGDQIWRILVAKNLAMAAMVTVAGLPVIAALALGGDGNPFAMIDQLVTMVFIWLGVGNVLSVVYPLRHEPLPARLHDGTWLPFAFSFALSYGVGLTVNLMIYWRLWSRQTAARELAGGDWAAFALVLASALSSWVLLTVFAVACSREYRLRQKLSREMVVYRKSAA